MPFSLIPKYTVDALTDIHPDFFVEKGVKLVMLDFDNTIVPYTTNEPTPLMASWLAWVRDCGVYVCVVSNSKSDRVPAFCKEHQLHCITHAKKPGGKGIRQCMNMFAVEPTEAVLIGDQIYTDTLGANCCGVPSILVRSIHNHNFWMKLRHVAELPFIFMARKRRISK